MASETGTAAHVLEFFQELSRVSHELDFFQVMRRLECLYRKLPRLGESSRPDEEPIRLAQKPSLAFAPAALAGYEPGKDGGPPRLLAHFFGLLGANGPLPLHLTEYAHERCLHDRDHTFARFLDVFNHRLMLLFYRAWASAQPNVSFDRPESDRFGDYVGSMCGIGAGSLHHRDAMPDIVKLHFAGRLACQTRNAEGLEAITHEFFRIAARVGEFLGHWLQLPEDCQSQLGMSPEPKRLGISTVVGARVWDRQSKFRIALGPMGMVAYERFLPGGASLPTLIAIVRNYMGDELMWDVNLILTKKETPALQLGTGARLGWTTWLISREPDEDPDDLCLNPTPYFG